MCCNGCGKDSRVCTCSPATHALNCPVCGCKSCRCEPGTRGSKNEDLHHEDLRPMSPPELTRSEIAHEVFTPRVAAICDEAEADKAKAFVHCANVLTALPDEKRRQVFNALGEFFGYSKSA